MNKHGNFPPQTHLKNIQNFNLISKSDLEQISTPGSCTIYKEHGDYVVKCNLFIQSDQSKSAGYTAICDNSNHLVIQVLNQSAQCVIFIAEPNGFYSELNLNEIGFQKALQLLQKYNFQISKIEIDRTCVLLLPAGCVALVVYQDHLYLSISNKMITIDNMNSNHFFNGIYSGTHFYSISCVNKFQLNFG